MIEGDRKEVGGSTEEAESRRNKVGGRTREGEGARQQAKTCSSKQEVRDKKNKV